MAIVRNISVKICGNQNANSGFVPLLLYNNPFFEVEDQFYVGFDNCPYFYTLKTTHTQTIYKLVINNVCSYGANRAGSLVIAFSIPKNYIVEKGFTPYNVLSKIKEVFFKRCMTCKDPDNEIYEFNQGRIDQHILDDVAKEFSIIPKTCPNRTMNSKGPKGYIVLNDSEIDKFFHDINYPEFDNYSEVIIADSVTQTSYIPINNIQIPRRIDYSIYVDGVYQMSCNDLNGLLTASSNKPEVYYDNRKVHFTIQKLKDGNFFEGIALDEHKERIDISTQNWAEPKREKFWIKIDPPKGFDKALINRNLIKVQGPSGDIRLDNDLSFTLVGEHIAEISSLRYFLADGLNSKYKISSHELNGDIVSIVIDVFRMSVNDNQQRRNYPPVPQNSVPIIDIRIVIDDSLKQIKNISQIKAEFKANNRKGEETLCSQIVFFHSTKPNRSYEGHFYVPRNNYVGFVEFSINDNVWKSKKAINLIADTLILEQKDFNIEQIGFIKRNIDLVKTFALSLLTLLFFALGFAVHDPIQSLFAKPETGQVSDDGDSVKVVTYGHLSEKEAEEILNKAKERLGATDVNFEEIADFYQKFNNDSVTLKEQDKSKFDDKICNQIKDYYIISQSIINGNLDGIKSFIQYPNKPHIWNKHKTIISKIIENSATELMFRNEYSNLKSFVAIDELFKTPPPSCVEINVQPSETRNVVNKENEKPKKQNRNAGSLKKSKKTTDNNLVER